MRKPGKSTKRITRIAKSTKAAKRPDRAPRPEFVAASIGSMNFSSRFSTISAPDMELVSRAVNTLYAAANLNATVCTGQRLRLYRPSGSGSKMWPGRRVEGRAHMRWLKGDVSIAPGRKAVALASAADDIEEVVDHPALDLIHAPDPRLTASQWFWLIWFWQELTGRAYAWVERFGRGMVTAMYPLAPQYTVIVPGRRSYIERYRYGRDASVAVDLNPDDVIYFRERVHPSDPLGAISWTHSVAMPSDLEAAALAAELKRWENGGVPGGFVELERGVIETDEQWRQYVHQFNALYSGVQNAGRWMIISGGKANQTATKPHEMNYREGLLESERRIWIAAGVPETVWKMADANRASAVQGDPAYMRYTILPKINAFAEALTEHLLPMFSGAEGWWFAFDNPVAEDRAAEVQQVRALVDGGILTANEARARLGLALGGPELDIPRFNGTALSLSSAGAAAASEENGNAEANNGEEPTKSLGARDCAVDDRVCTCRAACACDAGAEDRALPSVVRASMFVRDRDGVDRKARPDMTDEGREFSRRLDEWMDRAVRQSVGESGAVSIPLNDPELQRIIEDGLRSIFRAAARDALGEGNIFDFDIIDRAAETYARQRAAVLVRNVSETLRARIRDVVADGFAEGLTVNEIRDRLGELGIGEVRSEVIVRTEASFATQGAARMVHAEAGYEGKVWNLAGGPCPLCEAVAREKGGAPTPINEPYYRAGDSVVGTDGKTYVFEADVMEANAHPNCRCISTYVRQTRREGGG